MAAPRLSYAYKNDVLYDGGHFYALVTSQITAGSTRMRLLASLRYYVHFACGTCCSPLLEVYFSKLLIPQAIKHACVPVCFTIVQQQCSCSALGSDDCERAAVYHGALDFDVPVGPRVLRVQLLLEAASGWQEGTQLLDRI